MVVVVISHVSSRHLTLLIVTVFSTFLVFAINRLIVKNSSLLSPTCLVIGDVLERTFYKHTFRTFSRLAGVFELDTQTVRLSVIINDVVHHCISALTSHLSTYSDQIVRRHSLFSRIFEILCVLQTIMSERIRNMAQTCC